MNASVFLDFNAMRDRPYCPRGITSVSWMHWFLCFGAKHAVAWDFSLGPRMLSIFFNSESQLVNVPGARVQLEILGAFIVLLIPC